MWQNSTIGQSNNSKGFAGLGKSFKSGGSLNTSSPSSRNPGAESPTHFPSKDANYPSGSAKSGMSNSAMPKNESNGKQGPLDVKAASHGGAMGMLRLKNRVQAMEKDNSRVSQGFHNGGAVGVNL